MTRKSRSHGDDLRAASQLAVEATRGVMELVQAMHATIASGPAILGAPLAGPAKLATGVVYGVVKGVTGLVGATIDHALAALEPFLGSSAPGLERETIVGVLNGVLGDYLAERKNPLAITMRLRHHGEPLELTPEALRVAFPAAGRKVVVLVHGSCATDLNWLRGGHDHGVALARDLGYTPVYVHYNSGLHVSTNGRELAGLVEQLIAAWPVAVEDLVLLCHSMGGLIARSACHIAETAGHAWRGKLRSLVMLGTPHHGAPLERGGSWVQLLLGVSRYSAPLARLGRIRSAGITDLRFGIILDEHWEGRDRFEVADDPRRGIVLPAGVQSFAVAGTLSIEPSDAPLGDGMVPVASALGAHPNPALDLAFPEARRSVALGTSHLQLLEAPLYPRLCDWLSPPAV